MQSDRAALLYQGQASIRIVTKEQKVIYIDPYAGGGYDLPADLVLMTHGHFDHCDLSKIRARQPGCRVISWKEALSFGRHRSFDLGFAKVQAVEAGCNPLHSIRACVGFVLTIPSGSGTATAYVSGDTSRTPQMAKMQSLGIDYAFFCCDGVFNMGPKEAADCARLVGARHNLPYHMSTKAIFDRHVAEQFEAPNRIILAAGEELELVPAAEHSKGVET